MVTAAEQKAAKSPVWQGVFGYFNRALLALGVVSRMGANKHNNGEMPTKWRDYPIEVYADALGRHILSEGKDGLYDPESNLLHAAHAAWNALARLELLLQNTPLTQPSQVIEFKNALEVLKFKVEKHVPNIFFSNVPNIPSEPVFISERRVAAGPRRVTVFSFGMKRIGQRDRRCATPKR